MIPIEPNDSLFLAWAGLTASGCDLADHGDAALRHLVTDIRASLKGEGMRAYFARARGDNAVNPYYPKGSDLTAACFFLRGLSYDDFDGCLAFLKSAGGLPRGPDHRAWLAALPDFLREIARDESAGRLRAAYRSLLRARAGAYEASLGGASRILFAFSPKPFAVVFSPNLLQADCQADYVKKGGVTYVVAPAPDAVTMLHEALHPFLAAREALLAHALPRLDFGRLIDVEKLSVCGYLWDASDDSKLHALEECFVRGISVGLAASDGAQRARLSRWSDSCGFLCVPAIAEKCAREGVTEETLSSFLTSFLEPEAAYKRGNGR